MTTHVRRLALLGLLIAGCNRPVGGDPPASAPRAWIDRPLEGSEFLLGDTIPILWHASGDDGLRRIELRANGDTLDVADAQQGDLDPDLVLVDGEMEWTPAQAGEYLLQVFATGPDDAEGPPAENRVTVFAEGGTVAGVAYTDLNRDGDADDAGEGPLAGVAIVVYDCIENEIITTGPDGVFRFTDLPMEDCTFDFIGNGYFLVQTVPAGLDIPIHFTPDPASDIAFSLLFAPEPTPTPTASATPTPTRTPISVVTIIPVQPAVTTIAPPDNQAPPAPAIIGPKGGVLLDCLGSIVLDWKSVSDPSGIDVYQVRLDISYDNGATWSGVGSFELDSLTSLGVEDQTDCGNLYRWRVRARDNAGNTGPYSPFATFGIALP
jgi:hypothetical protein